MRDASGLRDRLAAVEERVAQACARAGRERDEVTLVAVSKTWEAPALQVLYDAGARDFGENYVQDWQSKVDLLPDDIRWHFIGHLQTNKVKYVMGRVHLFHGVDRASLVKELAKRAEPAPVDVLLQVNIGHESSKSGAEGDAGLRALLERALARPELRVRGLMAIPPFVSHGEENRENFRALRACRDACLGWFEELGRSPDGFGSLSMGMTADFEVAVEEGATHVRVGTAIFGRRDV